MTRCAECGLIRPPRARSAYTTAPRSASAAKGARGGFSLRPTLPARERPGMRLSRRPRAAGRDGAPRGAPVLVLRRYLPGAVRSQADGIRRSPAPATAAARAAGSGSAPRPSTPVPAIPRCGANTPADCPECGMALEPQMPAARVRTEYVCPMHPTVVRDAPGSCPECAMELEPRAALPDDGPSPELADMRRRLAVACVLTLPVLIIAMSEMIPGFDVHALGSDRCGTGGLRRYSPPPWCCGAAGPSSSVAWTSLVTRKLNMFTLVADRHRRGVARQHIRAAVPRTCSRRRSSSTARRRSTSRPPRSS